MEISALCLMPKISVCLGENLQTRSTTGIQGTFLALLHFILFARTKEIFIILGLFINLMVFFCDLKAFSKNFVSNVIIVVLYMVSCATQSFDIIQIID